MGFLDWLLGRHSSDDSSLTQKDYQGNSDSDTSISDNAHPSANGQSHTYVVSSSENPTPHTVRMNMNDYPVELTEEEARLIDEGQILQAIKLVRERMDADLASAKYAVDMYKENGTHRVPKHSSLSKNNVELTSEEMHLINRRETVQAIRSVHERTGLTLVDAKRVVDQYRRDNGIHE